jgi:acetyl esterase
VIPELEPMLMMAAAMPPLDFDDIAGMRAQAEAMPDGLFGLYVPVVDDVTTTSVMIPVADGEIELRIHTPDGADGLLPVLVNIHGGGWVIGSARGVDLSCRRWASRTSTLVVSVDYRLSPEVQFPVPLEDCYSALTWIVDHAAELGADATDVVISGTSAGGNLAAGLALLARDRGGPALTGQWLEVPALDLTLPDDESVLAFGAGFGLDRTTMVQTAACYASTEVQQDPYVSPLLASDLQGLPPAVITTAGCDPLRDQGHRYADALAAAGVPVRYSMWMGHLHSTMSLVNLADSTRDYEVEVIDAVAEARRLGTDQTRSNRC